MLLNQPVVLELIEGSRVVDTYPIEGEGTLVRALTSGYVFLHSWKNLTAFIVLKKREADLPRDKQNPLWIGKLKDGHGDKKPSELKKLLEER